MLILAVFAIIAIFFTIIVVIAAQDNDSIARPILICMPIQLFSMIYILIGLITPAKWGEVKLDAEYDLMPFVANGGNEYYASMGEGSYTIYLDNNSPITISTDEVTSVVYINENETPKVCRYVQQSEWTWYALPLEDDIVTYILFVPEGGIVY